MKIIIAPDSFKGTMTARAVADIMRSAALAAVHDAEIVVIPIADGGEGTVDALNAERIAVRVTSPFIGEYIDAFYGVLDGAAVIESAACIGLPLAGERKNPEVTTSYGVGELIRAALDNGCRKLILALGGSSTNDLGCGAAAALGVKFYGADGEFIPVGGTLRNITRIDASGLDRRIKAADIAVMCDVTNPLYGGNGAAYVFAPQKGADSEAVKRLDLGLRHAADIIGRDLGIELAEMAGGGAAGGLGAGAFAFLGASLRRGVEVILDAADFSGRLGGADLILTGEGRFDAQSLDGKAVSGVAARANGLPCIVMAGAADDNGIDLARLERAGITAVFSIQRRPLPYADAVAETGKSLFNATVNAVRLFSAAKKFG